MERLRANHTLIEKGAMVLEGRPVNARVQAMYCLVANFYDWISPLWVRSYQQAYQTLDRTLVRLLPPDGRVLDLGCGTGANLEALVRLRLPFASYTGVDHSTRMLGQARRKFRELPSARFRQLNLQKDPLPPGPFDLIVSTWVLEHLSKPGLILERARLSLKPDGHMLLMFEMDGQEWRDRLLSPIWRILSARLIPETKIRDFPGFISLERFGGIGPSLAFVVLSMN